MKFSTALSFLAAAGTMVSATPDANEQSLQNKLMDAVNSGKLQATTSSKAEDKSKCLPPLLCCGSLATPLDPLVDPILEGLGINAAEIVGSLGLLCHAYEKDSCDSAPKCCTEVNLLGGLLAVGCSDAE
ncbi:hydrophobin family protein [Aspergillus candidus]|uniref:Hydrophobin n=1 Tax=Aspergillus candidus TaxID=41067 RepID=A0A2I2FE54_ASPCN|nr:hypothetical protein BDW47DRAFT_20992 [Aspergillus candidus]PLB38889.1 hypothetical protein BDW47DRAFT_20992 [Aspergillus candidus]